MNMKSKFLRSVLTVLLALCLAAGMTVTALAAGSCGEAAAKATVEKAVLYCSNALTVVDVVEEYALGSYSSVIEMASGNPEQYRSLAVGVIKDELAAKADMIAQVGFDPNSEENMDLLANEVYDVAIDFYLDNQNHGKAVARENATKEIVRFVLVEVDGYSNAKAVETAESYYELNEMANSKGKAAAIEHVKSQQTHNYKNGVCTECGEADPSHTHSYTAQVVAPTCTKDGYTTYTCSCGDSYTGDEVKATGHSYTSKTVAPTCTEGGYTVYTCACGDSYTGDEVKATGHNYTSKTVAATCTEAGYTVYTCSGCGDSYQETLKATGHNYKSETVAPTCDRAGSTIYTCSGCGDSYTEEGVPATGHNFVNGTCDKCGVVETHNHSYTSKVVAPTCTEAGYTVHTCSCGDSYKDNTVAATGHSYAKGQTIAATCTEAGYTVYTCSACGDSYEGDVVAATGHSYIGDTCEKCGLKQEHTHSYTSEVVAPTCTANGYTVYTCECGDSYKDNSVAATGHDYVNGICSVCKAEEPNSSKPSEPDKEEDKEDDKNESSGSSLSWSELLGNLFGGDDDMSFGETISAAASKLMGSVRSLIKDWLSWLDYSGF